MLYSSEQIINLLTAIVITLFLSSLPECLEFPIETIGEVSAACMLACLMKTVLTPTVSLHELLSDLLKWYT